MVNSADFAKRLHKIIEFYGLSATSFSEKLHFNRSTISHILSGRNKPSLEFVMTVVSKFPEVELYWLLNGKGAFPSLIAPSNPESILSKATRAEISPNPISEEKKIVPLPLSNQNTDDEIDKIVIFYKDGSFKAYNN